MWQMLANRTLALFVIWLTAWFIITRKHSEFNLEKIIEKRTFALQKSEQQLLLVTESIPVIISYVDAEQRYKYVNAAYEKHFHIPRESIINITMAEVMGKKVYDIARPYIELGLSGESINFEYTYVAPDGSTRTFDVQYIPHLDSNDRTLGLYMLSNDITERKQIEVEHQQHRNHQEI